MTVKELIKALRKMDPNATVVVSPWFGMQDNKISDRVCVDYLSAELYPSPAVLISE